MTNLNDENEFEPTHSTSPTGQALEELQLYGYRRHSDEPDPRPLPELDQINRALYEVFDALAGALVNTRLEPDLEPLLWSAVNLFHRAGQRVERELDSNEVQQRRLQSEQDGSEINALALEQATAEGLSLIERRNAFEHMRDQAAEHYEHHTGDVWRPQTGSKVSHKHLTAAMIDSRDFIAARKRADQQTLLPAGPKIAVTGGAHFNDHRLIWDLLDKAHAKHPDMVLIHGGTATGAELIAAKWAEARKVPHIAFKPDWTRHGKAAPFKRNDALLETLPIGVLAFPGTGIQENLVDKARKLGIPVSKSGAPHKP